MSSDFRIPNLIHCDWITKKWFDTHLQSYFDIDIDIEDEKCIKSVKEFLLDPNSGLRLLSRDDSFIFLKYISIPDSQKSIFCDMMELLEEISDETSLNYHLRTITIFDIDFLLKNDKLSGSQASDLREYL